MLDRLRTNPVTSIAVNTATDPGTDNAVLETTIDRVPSPAISSSHESGDEGEQLESDDSIVHEVTVPQPSARLAAKIAFEVSGLSSLSHDKC